MSALWQRSAVQSDAEREPRQWGNKRQDGAGESEGYLIGLVAFLARLAGRSPAVEAGLIPQPAGGRGSQPRGGGCQCSHRSGLQR